MQIIQLAFEISVEFHYVLMVHCFGRSGLNSCQVDAIVCEDVQGSLKDAWLIRETEGDGSTIFNLPVGALISMLSNMRTSCDGSSHH